MWSFPETDARGGGNLDRLAGFGSRGGLLLKRSLDGLAKFGEFEGFGEDAGGAQAEGLGGGLSGGVGGHDDCWDGRLELAKVSEEFEPVHCGHSDVGDDQFG